MTAVEPRGRIAVTGANGFVGRHATRVLSDSGFDVVAVSGADHDLTRTWPDLGRLDGLLHLAGLAAVGPSFDEPQRYVEVNSSMMTHLGERLLAERATSTRVVVVSTGGVYGSSRAPLSETSPLVLTSPYVVSKALVELQAAYYRNRGLDVVVARPFNHIGPGQGSGFLVPDLTARIRGLRPGEPLKVGDLTTSRDYTDVRDVVRAYELLLTTADLTHDVYNVASGVSRTGHEVLGSLCTALSVTVDGVEETRQRGLDPDTVLADPARLRSETGWTPLIPFDQSIRDYVAAL